MPEALSKKSREPSPSLANAGARALARAVEAGDAAEVARLVAAGAAADVPQAGGETLLMRAAAKNHADVARALLDGGADANARRSDGFTPLLVAAFRGHAEVVRVLLERGADASVRTRLGARADEWAASHGFAETAGLLGDAARAGDGARRSSNGAAARASAVDERRAGGNVNGVGRAGASEDSPREYVAKPRRESPASPLTRTSAADEVLTSRRVEPVAVSAREPFAEPGRDAVEGQAGGLFASADAAGSAEGRRRGAVLSVALVLVAVAVALGALYAFVWNAKPPSRSEPTNAPAGGASNVVPQPAPQTVDPATNTQPAPGASPTDAAGAGSVPVIIDMPADVAPAGPATIQPTTQGTSAPVSVIEGDSSASDARTQRTGAGVTNAADGRPSESPTKGEAKGGEPRAAEESPRTSQGQGAEIRTAAPAGTYTMPPPNSAAQPTPEPSPKKKVIQWP